MPLPKTWDFLAWSTAAQFLGTSIGTSKIEYCYAAGPVNVMAKNSVSAGGFAAGVSSNISFCYATGDVTVTTGVSISSGGFLGYLNDNEINNCYATGNISVTITTESENNTNAGGLIGYIQNANVYNCFSSGSVFVDGIVKVSVFEGGITYHPLIYAGGFIGSSLRSDIQNCAVLGASVTSTAKTNVTNTTHRSGRIIGDDMAYFFGSDEYCTLSNNRAYSGMKVYEGSSAGNPTEITNTINNPSHDSKHGLNATGDDFRRRDIWYNANPSGANEPKSFNGMGFSATHWDFSTVNYYGYPVLLDENGQRMPGQ